MHRQRAISVTADIQDSVLGEHSYLTQVSGKRRSLSLIHQRESDINSGKKKKIKGTYGGILPKSAIGKRDCLLRQSNQEKINDSVMQIQQNTKKNNGSIKNKTKQKENHQAVKYFTTAGGRFGLDYTFLLPNSFALKNKNKLKK